MLRQEVSGRFRGARFRLRSGLAGWRAKIGRCTEGLGSKVSKVGKVSKGTYIVTRLICCRVVRVLQVR